MTKKIIIAFHLLISYSFINMAAFAVDSMPKSRTHIIPLGGNAWVSTPAAIEDSGLVKWTDPKSVCKIYFKVSKSQELNISLRLCVPKGKTRIRICVEGKVFTKQLTNSAFDTIKIGDIFIHKPGYVKIELQGITKTGDVFANVSDLIIKSAKPDTDMVYVAKGSSFHFGRRGPSVH